MAKAISPITVAQITAFRKANPKDTTDFNSVIKAIQANRGSYPCPCCTDGKVSNGTLADGTECHICDGFGVVADPTKIVKITTFSKKK